MPCGQIPSVSDLPYWINADPVQLKHPRSFPVDNVAMEKHRHVDYIEVISREFSHSMDSWCEALKMISLPRGSKEQMELNPTNYKRPLPGSSDPTWFIGRVGVAKIWLVFSEDDMHTEVFPEDSDCAEDYEVDTGTTCLPENVANLLKDAFQLGFYQAKNRGVSVPGLYLVERDDGSYHSSLFSLKHLNFGEIEWNTATNEVSQVFSALWPQIPEGTQSWFARHKTRVAIQLLGQNQIIDSASTLYHYIKHFCELTIVDDIAEVRMALAENLYCKHPDGTCLVIALKKEAGRIIWDNPGGFTTYPKYFGNCCNLQSNGSSIPPEWRRRTELGIGASQISFDGLQIYTTEKEVLRPSKEKLPFGFGAISRMLVQERRVSAEKLQEFKNFYHLKDKLLSLRHVDVGLRAEIKVSLKFGSVSDMQDETFYDSLRRSINMIFSKVELFDLEMLTVLGKSVSSVALVMMSGEYFDHAWVIATHLLVPIHSALNQYDVTSISIGLKEIVGLFERLLRAFLTGDSRSLGRVFTLLGVSGVNGSIVKYGFPFIDKKMINLEKEIVDWRSISEDGIPVTAISGLVSNAEMEQAVVVRDAAILLHNMQENSIRDVREAESFVKHAIEAGVKEVKLKTVAFFSRKIKNENLGSEEEKQNFIETISRMQYERFFAGDRFVEFAREQLGARVLVHPKTLTYLSSRLFPLTEANIEESPFKVMNYMSVWRNFIQDDRLFSPVESQAEMMVLRSMGSFTIKWFPNPGSGSLQMGNLCYIGAATQQTRSTSPSLQDAIILRRDQICCFQEPPTLEDIIAVYPSINEPLLKILNRFGTEFDREDFLETFVPQKSNVDFFVLCFALMFLVRRISGEAVSPPFRAAAIMVLFAIMKRKTEARAKVIRNDERKLNVVIEQKFMDMVVQFTQTKGINGGPHSKGFFQKYSVSPSLFFAYGISTGSDRYADINYEELMKVSKQDIIEATNANVSVQLAFVKQFQKGRGPKKFALE